MSILLDKLLKEADTSTTAQAKDLKWYIAKPLPFYSLKTKIQKICLKILKSSNSL